LETVEVVAEEVSIALVVVLETVEVVARDGSFCFADVRSG